MSELQKSEKSNQKLVHGSPAKRTIKLSLSLIRHSGHRRQRRNLNPQKPTSFPHIQTPLPCLTPNNELLRKAATAVRSLHKPSITRQTASEETDAQLAAQLSAAEARLEEQRALSQQHELRLSQLSAKNFKLSRDLEAAGFHSRLEDGHYLNELSHPLLLAAAQHYFQNCQRLRTELVHELKQSADLRAAVQSVESLGIPVRAIYNKKCRDNR